MSAIAINPRTLAQGLKTGKYRQTEIGIEKRCSHCGEYWPVDNEFYARQKEPGGERASAMCLACYAQKYNRGAGGCGKRKYAERASKWER